MPLTPNSIDVSWSGRSLTGHEHRRLCARQRLEIFPARYKSKCLEDSLRFGQRRVAAGLNASDLVIY